MYRSSKTNFSVTIRFAALCVGLLLVLAGCASRPDAGALAISTLQAPDAVTHDILVVSTRERDDRPDTYFNGERGKRIDFAEATISVPPQHKPGRYRMAHRSCPAIRKRISSRGRAGYIDGSAAFTSRLNQRLSALPRGQRTVFFVHSRLQHAVSRKASTGSPSLFTMQDFSGVPVLFSWASRGKLQDYVYDPETARRSRATAWKRHCA